MCMVITVAIKKSAKEGVNKKRVKSEILTEEHEKAILADIDHQVTSSHGCQKCLAFFFLVRLGIRGGMELWNLHRDDITVSMDKAGREYIKFEERMSKNNNYSMDCYSEEQFRNVYHSYEEDFVMTVKQYKWHLPAIEEAKKPDLFTQAITNPAGNAWYNKAHKVGKGDAGGWLKNMALLVGLPPKIFTNRSGRATLVTRMAAKGVPDEVGMAITGHQSTGGYKRYDRTQRLKMEAAAFVSANSKLDYDQALAHVSRTFVEEELVGSSLALKPLIDRVSNTCNLQIALAKGLQGSEKSQVNENSDTQLALTKQNQEPNALKLSEAKSNELKSNELSAFPYYNDGVDYEAEFAKDPILYGRMCGLFKRPNVSIKNSLTGNQFHNCSVTIKIVQPTKEEEDKENMASSS